MKKVYFIFSCMSLCLVGRAQMVIQAGSTVFLESGAKLVVQGDLTSAASIEGTGTVVMKGTGLQNITLNGNTVPNLEIDNPANVALSGGNAKIGTSLLFTNGKLLTGAQDLLLAPTATITGYNASRFIWTSGAGQVKKELAGDVSNLEIPVGENNNYRPVYITSTGGSYAAANIGVRNGTGASTNRPPSIASQIASHWTVSKTGITGGTQTIAGQYLEPTDVIGTEANLRGYFYNGTDWTSSNGTIDAAANRVATQLTAASGEFTAMNKFVAVGARAFLQGAYNSGTGLMTDLLRSGGANLIPLSDPYRSLTEYNSLFVHQNNTIAETVASSVFLNQAVDSNNIVDWVFVELRSKTSPFAVQQTRSALLQRDGDIVDIDGVSPVTFNNVNDGQYLLGVRHRNHIGIFSTSASTVAFTERKSLSFTANVQDLRLAATPLSGTANTNYARANYAGTGQQVNLLYSGNANANNTVNYSGSGNDRAFILSSDLGSNQLNSISGYKRGDVNLNRVVSYSGSGNDRAFLLATPLSSNQLTSKTQANPN